VVKATVRGYDVNIPDTSAGSRPTPVDPLLANLTALFDISQAEKEMMMKSNTSGLNATQVVVDWTASLNSSYPMTNLTNVTLPVNVTNGLNVNYSMPMLNFAIPKPQTPIMPQEVIVLVTPNFTNANADLDANVTVEPEALAEPTITFDDFVKQEQPQSSATISYPIFALFDQGESSLCSCSNR